MPSGPQVYRDKQATATGEWQQQLELQLQLQLCNNFICICILLWLEKLESAPPASAGCAVLPKSDHWHQWSVQKVFQLNLFRIKLALSQFPFTPPHDPIVGLHKWSPRTPRKRRQSSVNCKCKGTVRSSN